MHWRLVQPICSHRAEDEIYYVVSGRGAIVVAGERRPVRPGSIVFVAKEVEHRFVDIEEDLSLLVFFAPSTDRVVREHSSRDDRFGASVA